MNTFENIKRTTDKTEEIERQDRRLADAMPQIVWTARPDGHLDYYNQRWFEYTGMTLEETFGWGWQPVLHPDDVERCVAVWSEAVAMEKPYEIEYRFKRASDGQYRWHLGRALPVRDTEGKIIKWYGTCTDIDDQKKAETELSLLRDELEARVIERTDELSEVNASLLKEADERKTVEAALEREREFLSAVFESVTDGIVACDADGVLTLFNRATREFHGLPEAPVPAEQWAEHFDLYLPDGETLMKKEQVPLFRALQEDEVHDAEMVIAPKNARTRRLIASGKAIFNKRGQKIGAVVGMRNITEQRIAEEKLRKSEEQYRQIVDNAGDIIYRTDTDGCFTFVNDAAVNFIKRSPEELIGSLYTELIRPDYRARTAKFYQRQLIKQERETYFEYPAIAADGTEIWLGQNVQLLFEDEQMVGFQAVARDITERHRVEQSLLEATTLQRAILDGANYMLISVGLDGTINAFNRAAELLTGYAAAEVIGKETPALFHDAEEIRQYSEELVKELGQAAEPEKGFEFFVTRARTGIPFEREWTIIRKDKTRFPALLSISALRGRNDEVTGYLAVGSDISARKQAEESMRESENRFQTFMNNSPVVAFMKDEEGRFVYANKPFEKQFNLSQSAVIGRTDFELWSEEIAVKLRENDQQVIATGEPTENLEIVPTPDGSSQYWLSYKFPVSGTREQKLIGGVAIDVTAQKQLEAAVKLNEARMSEAQAIAHLGSWEFDIVNNKVNWSDELYRIFGLTPQEYDGTYEEYLQYVHPDDLERVKNTLELSIREKKYSDLDHRILRRDGTIRVVHANGVVIVDEVGAAVKMSGTLQDITERVEVENALRESEARTRELIVNAKDTIYTMDLSGNFNSLNPAGESLTGYTEAEALQMNIADVINTDAAKLMRRRMASNLKSAGLPDFELELTVKSGEKVIVDISRILIIKNGEPVGV